MRLDAVPEGRDFFITAIPEWKGTVLSHGMCGTRIRRAGKKVRTMSVTDRDTDKKVTKTIEADYSPELISSGTEVTLV